jgi:hypothetical protein
MTVHLCQLQEKQKYVIRSVPNDSKFVPTARKAKICNKKCA